MPTLTINGQTVDVADGTTVLQAIRQAGIDLPTLCYWEGLPPYGACRLCLVDLLEPDRQTVAACAYPASDGLVVNTNGEQALAARRLVLEFMLARCPTSQTIRSLAEEMGVTQSRFAPDGNRKDELCVLCGLCVRVCRDLVGAAAIGFIGRGADREVGAPFWVQAEACIGCGACAAVCPTAAIRLEDVNGERVLHTWNTTVPLKPCPRCGQSYAPEPMAFLQEQVEASEHLWGLCPACRRRSAAAQLEVVREAGLHTAG